MVNQLKHHREVQFFQTVYQRNFYLIGLISSEQQRKNNLKLQGMAPNEIDDLIEADRKQSDKNGQQVEKTLHLSDYFIKDVQNNTALRDAINRLTRLIHGVNGTTPTKDEMGMFTAASAAVRSACLSRQVGAAIMNDVGDILSTGCNDVPVAGGGLYSADHGKQDQRCFFKGGKCYNDHHKRLLEEKFKAVLDENSISNAKELADKLLNETPAKDLIEYSRAVHAEMDAIVQLARAPGQSTVGTTLYCTTYPCHSCARHIVAAGVKKVIYIEPYEKSLALQLHSDSISTSGEIEAGTRKVHFAPFEGVSPHRYFKFFKMAEDSRKKNGIAVEVPTSKAFHVDQQFLDSYFEYEEKVVERLDKETSV